MKSSTTDKINITLFAVVIFIIVSIPFTYRITDSLFSMIGIRTLTKENVPSMMGLVLHTIVFGLVVFASMYIPMKTKKEPEAEPEAEPEPEPEAEGTPSP